MDVDTEINNTAENAVDGDTICSYCAGNGHQWLGKEYGRIGYKRKIDSIKTATLLWSARTLKNVQETKGVSCLIDFNEKTIFILLF